MSLVPLNLTIAFEKGGWHRGRKVAANPSVPIEHPAFAVLAELNGVRLMRLSGDHEVCEVDFQFLPDKDELPRLWEAALGTRLVGIAEHHNAHCELYMSGTGHVFGNSIIHPAFWHVGRNFTEAMENLMTGHHGRPMLLDHQTSVMYYGVGLSQEDPVVLQQSSPEIR